MSAGNRNGWIDVLRALSAMAVVLFHINVMPQILPPGWPAQTWHNFWRYGYLGVGVFFTLSGYCLIPGWNRSASCAKFLGRRIWRIMPPYWGSIAVIIALAVIFKLTNGVNDIVILPHTPGSILATLLLLTRPVSDVPTINWVYWTLSHLLAFYLLLGLLLLVPARGRILALTCLHGILCLINLTFQTGTRGAFFFINHWPVFGIGCALALWPLHRRLAGAMLVISALHALWTVSHDFGEAPYVIVGCFTVAIVAATTERSLPAWLRPVTKIGQISYSVYLVHVPVAIYGLYRLMPGSFSSASTYIASQVALLGASLTAAWLFYLICERRFNPLPRAASPA